MLEHGFSFRKVSVGYRDESLTDPGKGILWVQNLRLVQSLICKLWLAVMEI